jgi:type IV pilus assembly protein PilA
MLDYFNVKNMNLHSNRQTGFTLIELMIILAIIAILMNMAMVSYKDYLVRSKISSGLILAASAKSAVTERYVNTGIMPEDNASAGLAAPNSITNDYVVSLSIGTAPSTGTITITYSMPELDPGDSILLTPDISSGGTVRWTCMSNNMRRTMLPSSCR